MKRIASAVLVGALLGLAADALAEQAVGTLDDPLQVDAFPYALAHDTQASPSSQIDSYSPCSPSSDESGPERVFRFTLDKPARVSAWVEGDGGGVDIDVHLLDDATVSSGVATSCVARSDVIAEAEMGAGEHFVVVDSYGGAAQAGEFVLHLEAIGDLWIERVVAEGVRWRARRFVDLNGPQVVHVLRVDTMQPEVSIRAIAASGCQTVGSVGQAAGAVAGINGGYFGSGCAPVSLLKQSGSFLAANAVTRGAFGLTKEMAPLVEVVAAGENWPAAHEAHGGGPVLVVGAVALQGNAAWAKEGFTSSGFNGDNPRTFAGYDQDGVSALATVDGRRANAKGMSLDELASFAGSAEVGLSEAVNLDGGGSSTMWIAGATPNGVVNYPSDAKQEAAGHPGSRPCSGGMFVFAPEYNHPPRFQTTAPLSTSVGESYSYDADAIDLDVHDVISYALLKSPAAMSIDAASGLVSFAPQLSSPPSVEVVIEASDDRGGKTEQSYTLSIAGGLGGGGGQGGGGGAGGEASSGGGDGVGVPMTSVDGCSCAALGDGSSSGQAWVLLLLLVLPLRRRMREPARIDAPVPKCAPRLMSNRRAA